MKRTLVIECECVDCDKKDEEIKQLTKIINDLNIELLREKLKNNTVYSHTTTTTSMLDDIFGNVKITYMEAPWDKKTKPVHLRKIGEQ